MARLVRDSNLETRGSRAKLKANSKYFRTIIPHKLHLGYRKGASGVPGHWVMRRYTAKGPGEKGSPYTVEVLGVADDFQDTKDDAAVLSFADAQKAAIERDKKATGGRGSLTVADAISDYIEYLKLERKTADDAERRARTLILPELGRIKIADLTADRISRWKIALAQKPARLRTAKPQDGEKKPEQNYKNEHDKRARMATVNRTLSILKAALNQKFDLGIVHDDLAWRRVKPFKGVQVARKEFLTLVEAKRLITSSDKESGFRDLVQGALLTGCRYGELCAARVRDFQRDKLTIPTSKSGLPRDVFLTTEGVRFFSQLTAGRGRDEWIFRRGDGSAWKTSAQHRPMRAACERAHISPLGFHQLRHTYASLALMGNPPVPEKVLADNLGHTDTRMIQLHYGHLTEKYSEKQIRAGAPTFGIAKSNVTAIR